MKFKRAVNIGILIFFILVIGVGFYFLLDQRSLPATSFRLKVAATIFPLYDMVRNVVGDMNGSGVEVVLIAPPGASPHTFEVSVALAKKLQGTRTIFAIGYGLDNWVATAENAVPDSEVVVPSTGIPFRKYAEGEEAGSIDPHYWLSIANAKIMVQNIAKELSRLDPEHASRYMNNASDYIKKLSEAEIEIKDTLSRVAGRGLVTMHDAWFYFAESYGLEVLAAFEPFPGQEPTQKYLINLAGEIKKHNVKVIFSELQLSSETLAPFLKDYGIALAVLDPEGSAQNDSYIGLMRYNAKTVYEALK